MTHQSSVFPHRLRRCRATLWGMKETTNTKQTIIERPNELLDGQAAETWQAYNAMETTKRRHYHLLEILDNRKKNYNLDPSEKDKVLLACLLKDHDEQVKRFTLASSALKIANAQAHMSLFAYIGVIGNAGESPAMH